ncbi:MAG TPA: cache domain-containing protein [Calditrichia bacterium]|nr:cache domain-containing protein [Calditrichia bacterium]
MSRMAKKIWQWITALLQKLRGRKISNLLMFTYLALGTIPLILAGLVLLSLTSSTVSSYIYERNLETARRASREIFLFIQEPLTILETTALSRDITEQERFDQASIINRIKDEHDIFRKVYILNDSGRVVVTTRFGEEGESYGDGDIFRTAMQDLSAFSEVTFTPSRFPVMSIARPIRQFEQPIGVLAGEIDLNAIWALVDSISIGRTGNAFLLGVNGEVIAHPDKQKVLNREDYSGLPMYAQLVSAPENVGTFEVEGSEQVLAYVQVQELGWGVVVQQSQEEAFTLARQMLSRVLAFIGGTILIALLLGYTGVLRLTQPLARLVSGAREYGRGNLQHRIDLDPGDELGELAREFNTMALSLQKNQKKLKRMEHLAAMSRFASLVSHEIRNPLNSMTINMQMLKRLINRPQISAERKIQFLDVMSSEITRMNDMVTKFLTIARPPELSLGPTDLHQVLEDVVLVQSARAKFEGVTLRTDFRAPNAHGMFDANQLKQVFHNLIVNAFEAIPETGVLEITTDAVRFGDPQKERPGLRIAFRDSGDGIPAEIVSEVFEYYYTTKRSGSGLGLALAKQIVEAHRGVVEIESESGRGTTVILLLPIEEKSPPAGE